MTTTQTVVTFNVNQFDNRAKITADLEDRIAGADVVILQELVDFDLARFARGHKGWTAHQLDAGENNGHANTAVLFRTELGPVEDTICLFVGRAHDTRARYLIGVKLGGVWYVAIHIFPKRDRKLIPAELKTAGEWAREHEDEPQVWGLDRNQATIVALESATALTWHGGSHDPTGGILTNLKVSHPREFPKGHSDHLGFACAVELPAAPKPHPRVVHAPNPEYVGPSPHVMHDAAGRPLDNDPIHRVVIHCTVSPCVPGGRYAIARLFNNPAGRSASCHYIADPEAVVQDVFDGQVAEHAPPNLHSIGIELCDPLASEAWDKAHAGRWHDAPHQSMLHHAARITARLCLSKGVPIRKLTTGQVAQDQHGICGHVNVSEAFHQSTHWDPGPSFPWADFLAMVQRRADRLQGKP